MATTNKSGMRDTRSTFSSCFFKCNVSSAELEEVGKEGEVVTSPIESH
jgi:hypothetical protein